MPMAPRVWPTWTVALRPLFLQSQGLRAPPTWPEAWDARSTRLWDTCQDRVPDEPADRRTWHRVEGGGTRRANRGRAS